MPLSSWAHGTLFGQRSFEQTIYERRLRHDRPKFQVHCLKNYFPEFVGSYIIHEILSYQSRKVMSHFEFRDGVFHYAIYSVSIMSPT